MDAPLPTDDPLAGRLAISIKGACLALDIGRTKLYELLEDHELDSYLDGPHRKVTTASIRAYIARKLAEPVRVGVRVAHEKAENPN